MSLWSYSGIDSANRPVKGKVVAEDVESAKSKISNMGINWNSVEQSMDGSRFSVVNAESDGTISSPEEERAASEASSVVKSFQETSKVKPAAQPVLSRSVPRQRVLFGPGPQVQSQAEEILKSGGRVIHALMSPDASGRPQVLMVIETEEQNENR